MIFFALILFKLGALILNQQLPQQNCASVPWVTMVNIVKIPQS
jgi:hypothetical protein